MGKTTTYANSLLLLIFKATLFANVAQDASSSPITDIHVSLLTADPGTTDHVNPAATITFAAGGVGTSPTASHFGIGKSLSGAGVRFYNGTVTPNIVCGNGVTPSLTTATQVTES